MNLWWYSARAFGLVAWGLASASVFWGLLLSSRLLQRSAPAPWLLDLHRYLGVLTAAFTVAHILAIVGDTYVEFGWAEVFVPFASEWKPSAVAWGVIAMYLMIAIMVTSWTRRWIPATVWKRVHLLAFPVFVLVTAHTLTAGTERREPLLQWSTVVLCAIFIFLLVYRLVGPRGQRERGGLPGTPAVIRGSGTAGAGATGGLAVPVPDRVPAPALDPVAGAARAVRVGSTGEFAAPSRSAGRATVTGGFAAPGPAAGRATVTGGFAIPEGSAGRARVPAPPVDRDRDRDRDRDQDRDRDRGRDRDRRDVAADHGGPRHR